MIYRHAAGVASPREIVTVLHEKIAAMSPEHAALVVQFEARQAILDAQAAIRAAQVDPRGAEGARRGRRRRIRDYARARDEGLDRGGASARAGVSPWTAERYETTLRRTPGEAHAWLR